MHFPKFDQITKDFFRRFLGPAEKFSALSCSTTAIFSYIKTSFVNMDTNTFKKNHVPAYY